jgi:hypothetical protein
VNNSNDRRIGAVFDQGHRGEVDLTQIAEFLALTPTQQLERHEGWRLFLKEALANAALRQGDRPPPDRGTR